MIGGHSVEPALQMLAMRPTDPFTPFGEKTIRQPTIGDVVGWMCRLSWQGREDTKVINLARAIVHQVQSADYASQLNALFNWGTSTFVYVLDPHKVELTVWPRGQFEPIWPGSDKPKFIEDCDGQAVFMSALCMALGFRTEFALASFDASLEPSHVFTVVIAKKQGRMVIDTVAGADTEKMLKDMTSCILVDCENGIDAPMQGLGMPFRGWGGWPR